MIKRIATAVAVIGAASIISGCSTEQPPAGCIVQDSSWALWQAKYMVKEADKDKACGQLKGEHLGVWKYTDPKATEAQIASNTKSKLGIRPRGTAKLTQYKHTDGTTVNRVPQDKWAEATTLSATLPERPDAEGFCKATGFTAATVDAAAVFDPQNADNPLAPETYVSYQFGDVQVYSHPATPGTQLYGTLTYTTGKGTEACTAEYDVWALWPAVSCTPGSTDPVESCGAGSGLNPDFDAVCDPDLNACVPAKRPPALKAQ